MIQCNSYVWFLYFYVFICVSLCLVSLYANMLDPWEYYDSSLHACCVDHNLHLHPPPHPPPPSPFVLIPVNLMSGLFDGGDSDSLFGSPPPSPGSGAIMLRPNRSTSQHPGNRKELPSSRVNPLSLLEARVLLGNMVRSCIIEY